VTSERALREVVEKALAGDCEAFETLVRKYARLVYAQAFMILSDRETSEDVVQETFVKAYTFRVRLRDPEKFKAWVLSIARNLARDVIRRRREAAPLHDAPEEDLADARARRPGWRLEATERSHQLETALAGLPEHYRTALTLRYIEGLDYRSIERNMGISNGALRGILGRALAGLRETLRRTGLF